MPEPYNTYNEVRDDLPKIVNDALAASGAINVELQDQHSDIVDLLMSRKLDDVTVLENTSIDDKAINIETTGTTPVVGDYLCLKETTYFYQGRIQSVTPIAGNQYTLGLNTPLDYAFTTSGCCALTSIEMNVNGSVTPVVFSVSPVGLTSGVSWDICRMIITVIDATAMDDGLFGGGTELTNGVVFRVKYNGKYKNIFTARTNGDFRLRSFDVNYVDATLGPGGLYSFGCRRSFNGQDKNGVSIRLENDVDPDEFQVIIQDDLTVLDGFNLVLQGHLVED